jgi:hypothetical protein
MFSVHYAYPVALQNTKGYRGEDKALEMDRKEGEACGVHRKGEA